MFDIREAKIVLKAHLYTTFFQWTNFSSKVFILKHHVDTNVWSNSITHDNLDEKSLLIIKFSIISVSRYEKGRPNFSGLVTRPD